MPALPSLFQFKRGDHTCVFYPDTESLLKVLTPYIAEGLRNGERCFCAQKAGTLQSLANDLRFLGVDVDNEMRKGALELHTDQEVYFSGSGFEPDALMELLERSIDDSVKRGFAAFRSAGDLSWALEGRDECDRLLEYELKVEESFPKRPAVGMCQYPIHRFPPKVLERVMAAHKATVLPGKRRSGMYIADKDREAEIVAEPAGEIPCYHYVARNSLNREILGWGSARTFDAAATNVQGLLHAEARAK